MVFTDHLIFSLGSRLSALSMTRSIAAIRWAFAGFLI